jgi:hypothetical protein
MQHSLRNEIKITNGSCKWSHNTKIKLISFIFYVKINQE